MDKRWAGILRFLGIGWYIIACILLGTLGGRWVGQKIGGNSSEVIFTILGLILGLIAAVFGVYRMFRAIESDNQDKGRGNR